MQSANSQPNCSTLNNRIQAGPQVADLSPALLEKYGAAVFEEGQRLLERRRAEVKGSNNQTPVELIAAAPPVPPTPFVGEGRVSVEDPPPVAPGLPDKVRTWSELNQAILVNKQAALARVWYLARGCDRDAKGWLSKSEFVRLVTAHLGMTPRRARGLLNKGMGLWWSERDAETLTLSSHRKLARHFEVKLGYAVPLPNRAFKRLATFRAFLYASWFVRDTWKTVDLRLRPTGGKTISLARQMELFGASRSTIKNWQKKAGMISIAQYSFVRQIDEQTPVPEHVLRGEGVSTYDVDADGKMEVVWRIPNRLSAPAELEAQRIKFQNRGLGSLLELPKAEPGYRLYYDKPAALQRLKSREVQGRTINIFKLVRPGGTRIYQAVAV